MTKYKGKPDEFCPKCGYNGFLWSEPKYKTSTNNWGKYMVIWGDKVAEWLEWPCTICEYKVFTKVFIEVQ